MSLVNERVTFLVLFIVLPFISFVSSSRNPIHSLPGLTSSVNFQQYGGYINVNITLNKNYYYWFVESQNEPEKDPVLVWLQGGPGCSGLLGFWQENGPFVLQADHSVTLNPLSWNRYANVIYVEQPAGVGFSYSENPSGYSTDDNQTAIDNYQFLKGWYETFPEFSSNPLWLTGESYAGVYIPTLANQILEGSDQQIFNAFQGFMVGNPSIYCPEWLAHSKTVFINLWYWHGLVSFSSRNQWFQQGCHQELLPSCEALYSKIRTAIGPFNPDDLYFNFCTGNGTLTFDETVPNCNNQNLLLEEYMNRKDVQAAIHANPPATGLWEYCTSSSLFKYTQLTQNMLNYYNKFFNETNWRILIYSGDVDIATVPHAYTQLCLSGLKRPTVQKWSRWTIPGPTIVGSTEKSLITAGYQEIYDKYTFATVRGAGHEVPTYQPWFAYNMLERFIIHNQNL